ncbi:MAG: ATPase [Rhizobiales bacterium]|nr:ATPase [Hyphomicrobiales bacterium]
MSDDLEDKLKRAIAGEGVRNLPKRFYKQVSVGKAPPFLTVLLDGRPIRTPMKAQLAVPVRPLAEALAQEWDDQAEKIDPARMPLTRLCKTAIDRVSANPQPIIDEITEFAGSDLLCYRADTPEGLVGRQQAMWDPLLAFADEALGARFVTIAGVMHQAQPDTALAAISSYLGAQDAFALTAIHNITTLTGSCLIAVAVHHGRVSGVEAWSAAHVDEDWQIEQWGPDDEGAARRAGNKREFDAALKLLTLLKKD